MIATAKRIAVIVTLPFVLFLVLLLDIFDHREWKEAP